MLPLRSASARGGFLSFNKARSCGLAKSISLRVAGSSGNPVGCVWDGAGWLPEPGTGILPKSIVGKWPNSNKKNRKYIQWECQGNKSVY